MSLGVLKIPVNKRQYFVVEGGPFMDLPKGMKGVKMAKEIQKPCDVDIPTVDFQTPDRQMLLKGLQQTLDLMIAGEPVYVGCMGGKGRTGLFLAVLAKVYGVKNPVEYVRANYYAHAVETADQYAYVKRFVVTRSMKRKVKKLRKWSWLKFWKTNLTRLPARENPALKATVPVQLTALDKR